jgi:hypothetical protein
LALYEGGNEREDTGCYADEKAPSGNRRPLGRTGQEMKACFAGRSGTILCSKTNRTYLYPLKIDLKR